MCWCWTMYHMTRRGIAAVLPPDVEEEPEEADEDDVDGEIVAEVSEDDGDELAVTDGEEAVRTVASEASAGNDRR